MTAEALVGAIASTPPVAGAVVVTLRDGKGAIVGAEPAGHETKKLNPSSETTPDSIFEGANSRSSERDNSSGRSRGVKGLGSGLEAVDVADKRVVSRLDGQDGTGREEVARVVDRTSSSEVPVRTSALTRGGWRGGQEMCRNR